jgi:hypothetical protein
VKLTYYRWTGGHLLEMHTFRKVYFDTVPKLTYEFDLFNVEVDAQEITLELYYNADNVDENGTDRQQWNWWHQQNYEQIGAMKLTTDAGVVLFEGVVDADAERGVDHANRTLSLTYFGTVSYMLDKTLYSVYTDLEITTGFYRYSSDGGASNDGGAIAELVQAFFARYLASFTPHLPEVPDWELTAPVPWYYMQTHAQAFYMGYRVLWDDETSILDALKDLLAIAGLRVVFAGTDAFMYSYRNGYKEVTPDGKLVGTDYVITRQNDLASSLNESGLYSLNCDAFFRFSVDGETLDYETGSDYILYCIPPWLQQYTNERSRKYTFTGYNTNLAIANMFEHNSETVIVTKIERDLRYIEAEKQPVELEAEVIYAD